MNVIFKGPFDFFGKKSVFLQDELKTENKTVGGVYVWAIESDPPLHFLPFYVGRSKSLHKRLFYYLEQALSGQQAVYYPEKLRTGGKATDSIRYEKSTKQSPLIENPELFLNQTLEYLHAIRLFFAVIETEEDRKACEERLIDQVKDQHSLSNKQKNFKLPDRKISIEFCNNAKVAGVQTEVETR